MYTKKDKEEKKKIEESKIFVWIRKNGFKFISKEYLINKDKFNEATKFLEENGYKWSKHISYGHDGYSLWFKKNGFSWFISFKFKHYKEVLDEIFEVLIENFLKYSENSYILTDEWKSELKEEYKK